MWLFLVLATTGALVWLAILVIVLLLIVAAVFDRIWPATSRHPHSIRMDRFR